MNKRLITGAILLVGLILTALFVHDYLLREKENLHDPIYLNNYSNVGYFKFNPETILTSLEQGNTNIFTSLQEDPSSFPPLTNITFSWKQTDFLKVARATSQLIWDDDLDTSGWSIYNFYVQSNCQENLNGFNFAHITFFKIIDVNEKKIYTTRHIEIQPYYGMIRWGSGAIYPIPILQKWKGFDLSKSVITAEEAIQISEQYGAKESRQQVYNKCLIIVSSSKNNKWLVNYVSTGFSALIDIYTGEYEVFDKSR